MCRRTFWDEAPTNKIRRRLTPEAAQCCKKGMIVTLIEKLRIIAKGFSCEKVTTAQARSAVPTLREAIDALEKYESMPEDEKIKWIKVDIDGQGEKWRLAFDHGEDWYFPMEDFEEDKEYLEKFKQVPCLKPTG